MVGMCTDLEFWVWFIQNLPTDREHLYKKQTFFSYRDGSPLFKIGESEVTWALSTPYLSDLEYSKETAAEKGYDGVFITGYTGDSTKIELPKEIKGLPVTGIAAEAFLESGIEEIGLPEGMRYIGERAFYNCDGLTFVGLPNSFEIIDEAAAVPS